jgi:hypothetical protein
MGLPGNVTQTDSGFVTDDTSLQSWPNPSDVELVWTGLGGDPGAPWTESRCPVASITSSASATAIAVAQPCFDNNTTVKGQWGVGTALPTSVENSFALLDQPGEWYLDTSAAVLFYIPRSGEDMATAEVIAPVLETLLSGTGVHDLGFLGLTFAHATWLGPNSGLGFPEIGQNVIILDANSGAMAPANVSFQGAVRVRFEGCIFIHLGAQGLSFSKGSQNDSVLGNVFTDISGTAIRIGDIDAPNATGPDQDLGTSILNNYIHDLPVEYRGGPAITATYVAQLTVSHNHIARTPYDAIALGYGFETPSYAQQNVVAFNHIDHSMQLLWDGGGIYAQGAQGVSSTQGRSSVHDNYIHDHWHYPAALYFDEATAYVDVYDNVLEQVPQWISLSSFNAYDFNVHDNFSDTAAMYNEATNVTMENNYTDGLPWPAAALDIIANAGLEPAYRGLLLTGP